MNVRKVSANTVKHRHANIHKALSYAYKTDLIQTNPADKVELPTIDKFVGHFYNAAQLEEMFKIFKGDPAEFGVIAASFYGLRRSEVLGLRWDAIDFEEKTITIRHTVNETRIDGKYTLVLADTTKTKSSYRTLPLVAPFEAILKRMKAEQEENRKLCGNCYRQDYLGYIYVNELGELIKPGYLDRSDGFSGITSLKPASWRRTLCRYHAGFVPASWSIQFSTFGERLRGECPFTYRRF